MTRIEFVRQWGTYQPGQVVEYEHDGGADVLVNNGTARLAGGVRPTTVTTTAVAPPPATGTAKANRPKTTRRRK